MPNLLRVLERQQKPREEIRRRRAQEDRDADEEEEQMLAAAHDVVGALGLIPEQKLTAALRMLAYGASAEQVDEIARMGKSTILECLVRFCDVVKNLYTMEYLRKPTPRDLQRLLKKGETRGFPGMIGSIDCMHWQWKNCPTAWQREYGHRKGQKSIILEVVASFDCWVWHAFFGVAGSQNDLNVLGQSPMFDEDEYDYDAPEVFEPDPMNTSLTRIYERPIGPNGLPLEPEPLLQDGQFNNPMIDRYQEMQSSYVHEIRQGDLVEHLWEMKGNHNG
ncbi:PREDICTED: uncharacterized protein LOC103342099 [Prunus mume]|uniref:Uncharacterized protein LOC103342099 n=1 Tax=Prunus mume TaxID=102107 RepID=A0ABM0PSP1_PRUMU|nr:PREDICTED: uncharacterized protein LOC103342099 [Prunus mume]